MPLNSKDMANYSINHLSSYSDPIFPHDSESTHLKNAFYAIRTKFGKYNFTKFEKNITLHVKMNIRFFLRKNGCCWNFKKVPEG